MLNAWFARHRLQSDNSLNNTVTTITISLLLVALLTAGIAGASIFADLEQVTSIYLIPVMFAAIRGGVGPAVISALAGIGAAAFFFYPPIFDFRVQNTVHVVDLVLFIFVAVVTGKLASDLRRAKMREEADMLREALIGSVSHELRTPLSSIIGSASVLAQAPAVEGDERLAPLIRGLREEADRLNEHIGNLLDASRISVEGIRPHPEWIDPGDVVNAAVERKRKLLDAHRVDVEVADDLPLIHVDAMLIERALGQLIENAVKYSPRNSQIEVRAEQNGPAVKITVRDEGAGLTREESERIWERFFRGSRHRDSIAGSGLGLWIARALVVACGGRVDAFSAGVGHGTTFAIELPVQKYEGGARMGGLDE